MASVVTDVRGMVRYAVNKVVPVDGSGNAAVPAEEVLALGELCAMTVSPSRDNDPKSAIRSLSNETINRVAARFRTMSADPVVGPLFYMFLMEWGFRNGCLDGDWTWQWDSDREGQLRYATKAGTTIGAVAGRAGGLS